MGDRDINGMKARNWKDPSVSGLDSISIKSKNDNTELFDGLKKLIEEAVYTLYGDAKKSEKYVMIIDLIMMRIRAALDEKLDNISVKLSDDQVSSIVSAVDDKIKSAQESGSVQTVQQVGDTAQAAAEEAVDEATSDEQQAATPTVETENSKQLDELDDSLNQFNIDLTKFGADIAAELDKLQEMIDQSTGSFAAADTAVESKDQVEQLESLNDNITKFDEDVSSYIEKLELVTGKGGKNDKDDKSAELGKQYNKKLIKQIRSVNDVIERNFKILSKDSTTLNDELQKKLDKNTKLLDQIVSNQKGNWSIGKILMLAGLAGGVLIAIFWDKIWPGIKEWLEKIPFVKTILGWISILDPLIEPIKNTFDTIKGVIDKLINMDFNALVDEYWPVIKKAILDAIGALFSSIGKIFTDPANSPLKWVIDRFKEVYNGLTAFVKDVWAWITGESKNVKNDQDKNERKAEAASTTYIDGRLADNQAAMEKALQDNQKTLMAGANQVQANVDQNVKSVGKTLNDINSTVENSQNEINQTTSEATQTVTDETERMTQNVNNSVANQQKTMDTLDTDMHGKLNSAVSGVDKSVDGAIKKAEEKADADMKKTEEKMKQDGRATSASSDSLKSLEEKTGTEGGSLGDNGEKPEIPSSVGATNTTINGQQTILYAKKDELEKGQRDAEKAGKLAGTVYVGGATSDTLNTIANIKIDDKMPDFKTIMADTYKDVTTGTQRIADALKAQNTGLEQLTTGVHDYIEKLNEFITGKDGKSEQKKAPPPQPQQQTVVIAAGGEQSSMAKENH